MKWSDQDIIDRVLAHDHRAVARAITLAENHVPRSRKIQAELFKKTGRARVVGVTGSPGAGKSTLVDQLADLWREQGKKVAILAVDPTSPFSGGAILGDRIRMNKSAESSAMYIRSMATRGALGGIARATWDAVQILDAAGFDVILIETVGVGQAEVDIVRTADTVLVVLVPGMGDSVQVFKAGILEIADLFVINKADRDGADLLQKDLRVLMSLVEPAKDAWVPPICRTIATTGQGACEVVNQTDQHGSWLQTTASGRNRKLQIIEDHIVKLASELIYERVLNVGSSKLQSAVEQCFERKKDPYTVVEELIAQARITLGA